MYSVEVVTKESICKVTLSKCTEWKLKTKKIYVRKHKRNV